MSESICTVYSIAYSTYRTFRLPGVAEALHDQSIAADHKDALEYPTLLVSHCY